MIFCKVKITFEVTLFTKKISNINKGKYIIKISFWEISLFKIRN